MIKEFALKYKTELLILSVLFLVIFFYMYNKNKENLNSENITGGSIFFALCMGLLPCVCWLVILYFITKNAAKSAIMESGLQSSVSTKAESSE